MRSKHQHSRPIQRARMPEPASDSTGKRVRRLGIATFATLCLEIALSLVGYVAISHQRFGRMQTITTGDIAWIAAAFITSGILCVLIVFYLRHLFRDNAAPRSRVLWTILIIFLGAFAMAYYWTVYMRRLPHKMA